MSEQYEKLKAIVRQMQDLTDQVLLMFNRTDVVQIILKDKIFQGILDELNMEKIKYYRRGMTAEDREKFESLITQANVSFGQQTEDAAGEDFKV